MSHPPKARITADRIPSDPVERHEALVSAFGGILMQLRQAVLQERKRYVSDEEERGRLAKLHRELYDKLAEMPVDQRNVAVEFSMRCMDAYAKELLRLLGNRGNDLRTEDSKTVRFRLVLEISDPDTGQILVEDVVNWGGRRFLPEYWGAWLNEEEK